MRIVVVEDETPIREGLSKILGKLSDSYELTGKAENGAKGLELVRNTRPDLVILDIRMPDMDGLTMLEHIREEKINCKAIVLSAYSDFDYAKRAIELGIEYYLLKPIKIPELKRVLKETEESISKEQSKEHLLSLEHVFLNAITGQLEDDAQLAELLKEKYGIERDEPIAIFGIGMGANYDTYREYVKIALEDIGIHNQNFKSYPMEFAKRRAFVMILYHMEEEERVRVYFEKNIVPMLSSKVSGKLVLSWSVCRGLLKVRDSVVETTRILEWNLILGKKVLLTKQKLDELVEQGKKKGYVTTMFGRRRPIPELKSSNFMQRSFGERVAMNSPIQGTAADIIKIAMNRVYKRLKEEGLRSRLVLQVHDELLIETYKEEIEQVSAILEEEMKGAANLSVELEVDMHQGNNWYEAK